MFHRVCLHVNCLAVTGRNVTAVNNLMPINAEAMVPVHSLWLLYFYASSAVYVQMQHKVKVIILTLPL